VKSKVKGGALLYSLFIITVVGALTSIVITISYFSNVHFIKFKEKSSVLRNTHSGMELLLSESPIVAINREAILDLYSDGRDSVKLKRLNWGLFEVASSTAFCKNKKATKVALIGQKFEDVTALYLADRNKPLSLAGRTVVKGKIFLPKKGVKRAYIEGTTYMGDKLLYGTSQTSKKSLPDLNKDIELAMKARMGDVAIETDSMVPYDILGDSVVQSFTDKTILAYSSSVILLDNKTCVGNVVIKSTKGIVVSTNSVLENTLLYAPYIIIDNNFTGTLQAFATDSLLVGSNVDLEYPSSLGLIQLNKSEQHHFISVGEESVVDGVVIAYQLEYDFRNPIKVSMQKASIVKGYAYVNGLVELKGSIFGTLYCNRFSLKTPSTVYENHLLNATIDVTQRSEMYVGPNLTAAKTGRKEVIQWLN
jgi:hypothetical protein